MRLSPAILRRFFKYVTISAREGCWLWQGTKHEFGYGQFWVNDRLERAHRVAWEFFVGAIPLGLCVLHRCDNPGCVNPNHLFLGTKADNTRDMCEKGRSRNGPTKLTEKQIQEIRHDLRSQYEIAKEYDISQAHVSRIKNHKRWRRSNV